MPFIASNGLTEAGTSKTIAAGGMHMCTTTMSARASR